LQLLEAAFDSGVSYFDVARSYGYGEAEGVVGEFARGRRQQLTIATKLGIEPPRRSRGRTVARAAARRLAQAVPAARATLRRRAEGMTTHGSFGVPAARASLETSLRELRADYVDVLLLHECEPGDLTPELLEFLRERVAAGQVRRYGIATGREASRAILAAYPDEPLVVQVPFDAAGLDASFAPAGASDRQVVHSVLAQLGALHQRLIGPGGEVKRWSRELDVDLSCKAELSRLLLRVALAANPDGTTLFASRGIERVRANAQLEPLPVGRLTSFGDLVRGIST
jgi:hypothetical protein